MSEQDSVDKDETAAVAQTREISAPDEAAAYDEAVAPDEQDAPTVVLDPLDGPTTETIEPPVTAPTAATSPMGHIRVTSPTAPASTAPAAASATTMPLAPPSPPQPPPPPTTPPTAPAQQWSSPWPQQPTYQAHPSAPRAITVVWGLIVAAVGIVLLSISWGAHLDTNLALIILLGAAGLALLVGSVASMGRSRRRREPQP
ncbi:MAG: hypothetical protein FWF28_07745 [Micrococcales bacterium]|nr:hypothetical protein [Micrococcales bacterium]